MVNCPMCGKDAPKASKEWDYAVFHVKQFNCGKCDKNFMAYYREGKLSHTIPKAR